MSEHHNVRVDQLLQYLREGKVESVQVSDQHVRATLKQPTADGKSAPISGPIPDLGRVVWKGRKRRRASLCSIPGPWSDTVKRTDRSSLSASRWIRRSLAARAYLQALSTRLKRIRSTAERSTLSLIWPIPGGIEVTRVIPDCPACTARLSHTLACSSSSVTSVTLPRWAFSSGGPR